MSYFDQRIKNIADKAYKRMPFFGMALRIIIMIALLYVGQKGCEWAVGLTIESNEITKER